MADVAPFVAKPKYEATVFALAHSFHMEPEIRSKTDGMRVLGWSCVGVISSIESNTVYLIFEREVVNG